MEKIQLGTTVKPLGIRRAVCSENCKGRAILLDDSPRYKYLAYDEKHKAKVEVNQDAVIKYGLRPNTTYFYLIARLNTDMKGNVVGDEVTVEYLQLSESLNNKLAESIQENPNFNSLVLGFEKRTGDNGKDFSYTTVGVSQYEIPASTLKKVDALKAKQQAINTMWQMIDTQTSISVEAYEQKLLEARQEQAQNGQRQVVPPARRATKQLAQENPQPDPGPMPQAEQDDFNLGNELGSGDDFNI